METGFLDILGYTIALIGLCPYVMVRFLPADTVTAALFVLMYFINPVYCIMIGIVTSKNVKEYLIFIFLPAIVFTVSYSVIFRSIEPGFIFYGFVYLVISAVTLLIALYIRKKKEQLYS
ncbi:MAG TPA: hypothetical protein PLI19_02270 [Erysipelotrichaceae bacterium]|nr:hypothetical protein [Erysipelotrichaceae bacterium]